MRLADRYELLRRVGEGGGGGVYLVRDRLADGARMVLKRLHAHAQTGVAQWLVNEFQILAQLDMPTVARVFDFGLAEPDAEDPGGPFFTRAFVDGTPLDQALRANGALDPASIIDRFVAAAETLAALHRLGVAHGDLKPANLIVPREGPSVVLIDFGLAHGALGAVERVRGGTFAFMPPERRERILAGESLPPDPRADVYALAASMLAVLGVESPEAPAPDAVQSDPTLQMLLAAARRGVANEPDRRFATADDFRVAIARGVSRPSQIASRVVLRPEGREAELGAMLDHIARRLVRREAGPPSVMLVGDEGSGRSTLLRELAWRAELRGVQVLHVQGEPGEGPARRLRDGATVLGGEALTNEKTETLVSAFRRATRGAPVLVLADDLDRADPAIAEMLRSIAYGCEADEPLLVVAAVSDAGTASRFAPAATVLLGPLDESAIASLCAQTLGPVEPGVASAVEARTGGSPLAVTEVLGALASSGGVTAADVARVAVPSRARDLVRKRLEAANDRVRSAVACVVALGAAADATRVRAVESEADVDAARAAGWLTVRADGRLALAQPALADVVLEALDASSRGSLLARAAAEIDRSDAPAPARAEAWLRAGDASSARRYAADAVRDLRAAGLPRAAAQLLAALRTRDAARATLDDALLEAELFAEAGARTEALAAAESVIASGDAQRSPRARLLTARLLERGGDLARARAALEEGLASSADGDLAAEFLCEIAWVDFHTGSYADSAARCERAMHRARAPRVRALVLARWGLATSYLGDQPRAIERLEQALALFANADDPREEARVLAYLAIARDRSGELNEARALYERTLERARAAGDVPAMASARLNLGTLLDRLGDLAGALEHFAAAAKLAQRAGDAHGAVVARINTAGDLIRVGSYDRARAELDTVLDEARTLGARELVAHATGMLGVVRARTGDPEGGLGLLAEATERFAAMGFGEGVAEASFDTVEVLLDRGLPADLPRVAERLAQARGAVTDLGTFEARGRLLEARLLLARGDARGAQRLLGESIQAAEATHAWETHAQALAARAQAHQAVGAEIHARRDRERALEVLEATAALLPPDLRSAFWSVPQRVGLRAVNSEISWNDMPRTPLAASASVLSVAPTVIAQDHRLVLLLELSRRIGEEQTLERVLDQAVRSAVELTNAERGAILLVSPDGSLAVRARSGSGRGDGPDDSFSRSIAETVLIDGEVVATHNARGDSRFADFRSVHELAITAVAAVPIRARGRVLGVLYVENRLRRTVWSPSDLALMKAFAEQAGITVEHARLVEELEARTAELESAKRDIELLLQERTAELESTRISLERAQEALKSRFAPQGLVAQTEAMRKVFAVIDRVRDSDVPVVIEGESGTGKELVARAIHFSGARRKGPFVVVHCGAIPETLLESELFGHVKGAFTGADRDRKGLLPSANGGTVLLDEVADMSLKMQVELLRVLQEKRVRPVGGDREEPIDVRFLVAANRPLKDLAAEGRFREDLYYRLSVVTMRLPPLRARIDDIPALATHFLERIAEEHGVARRRLSREALHKLLRAPWPGNVRQLRHVLESAAVLAEGNVIEPEQLAIEEPSAPISSPPPARGSVPPAASPMAVRRAAERQRILDALEQVNWNKVRAATVLGMPRRTLYRRLREYGLLEE